MQAIAKRNLNHIKKRLKVGYKMNSLWERLSVCKAKIKELEAKLDSATKELQQLNDEISYISVCSVQKE